jgi:hypothetical protein|nr:MAG TPA: hypothetical protein [Caudoviricetes sp.]
MLSVVLFGFRLLLSKAAGKKKHAYKASIWQVVKMSG